MGLFPADDPEYAAVYAEEGAMVDAAEAIAEALEASGMKQSELARALKVSRSEITERLRGNRNITVRNLAATIHALGGNLHITVTTPERAEVSSPIELSAYRKWTQTATDRHEGHSSTSGRYVMSGRQ